MAGFPVFRLKSGEHHYGAAKYGTRVTATAGQILEPTSEKELKFFRAYPDRYEEMPEGTAPTVILPKRDKEGKLMESAGEQEEELSEEELMVRKSEFDRPDSEKRNLPVGELAPARPMSHVPLQKAATQIMTPGTASAKKEVQKTETKVTSKSNPSKSSKANEEGTDENTEVVEIRQEDLEHMNEKELLKFCEDNDIDVKGATKKQDILKQIKKETK